MHNKYVFASLISKGLALRAMKKAGRCEEEKGTRKIHSKETKLSPAPCQLRIIPETSWRQVSRDILICNQDICNLIVKSLTQNRGRERTENHQNRKQSQLSCRNGNLSHIHTHTHPRSAACATWITATAILRKYNTSQYFT